MPKPNMKKVLVVDDDPAVRSLTGKLLQSRGYQTLSAEDGQEGLELARKYLPDLIICDIHMPNLDGYQTLAALQKDPMTAAIPFIFLTAVAGPEEVRYATGLGADDYLTKPFTVKDLVNAVNTRLAKKAAMQRLSDKRLEELRSNIDTALPHELLTPLNGILGMASLLGDEESAPQPHEVRDFARSIQHSALRLHALIENFIMYSGLELIASDPKKIAGLRTGISCPTKEAIAKVARNLAEAALRPEDLLLMIEEAEVVIHPDYLKKAAEELIETAFKFSVAGRLVRVSTSTVDRQVVLTVADEGRGMTAEQIAGIGAHMQFERRFYEQQGAGLGLIIARRIAELHGGDLRIESAPGQFTQVQLVLPLAREHGVLN